MCGIVGYVGHKHCVSLLINGLEGLEYRGYDSAGVAVYDGQQVSLRKAKGRLTNLKEYLKNDPIDGLTGIGHTRWATHGEPNDINAHPHTDALGNIAIVHNGIIENYYVLRKGLEALGVTFRTETDTEVIVQLLGYYYDGDIKSTLYRVLPMLEGSFGLAIIDAQNPEYLYCTRKDSPLVIGKCDHGYFVASDIPAMLQFSRDMYMLDDMDIAVVHADSIHFYDEFGNSLTKEQTRIEWDVAAAEKGGYPHFMLKEIYEQPIAMQKTLDHYVTFEKNSCFIKQDSMPLSPEQIQNISRITILACGTAYHAGMVGSVLIEQLTHIPVNVAIASEYRYRETPILKNELFIVISQSGETADTIAAMRKARKAGCPCVALCNVIGSTIAREADCVMYTLAGPEIAVASTKAYTSQVLLLTIISLHMAHIKGCMSSTDLTDMLCDLRQIPDKMQLLLDDVTNIQQLSSRIFDCKSVFFIGRGLDYCTALEAALKLKEISYIHSESYAAGELKHGTIALIEEGTVVVAFATQEKVREKMFSNIEEVRVRGAQILLLAPQDDVTQNLEKMATVWTLPAASDVFSPLLAIVPMQLFAYFMALQKGCDIDKPRNLAKSVTVE